jgi:acyl-lipid omega-6 desaturase (Delta-12 desaturase)
MTDETGTKAGAEVPCWRNEVAAFQQPSTRRALRQLGSSLGLHLFVWFCIYLSLGVSWWLILLLAFLAGATLVRVFIIFHDCGHGSYFPSRRANELVGFITGMLTFTPFHHWRWEHSIHHTSAGHLDKRGIGDVWTLTVDEYLESPRRRRLAYRLARNPFVLFLLAPLYEFLIRQRFPAATAAKRERRSVYWMNLALLGMITAGCCVFGVSEYLMIQLIVITVAGSAGIWLFYVQHQFEGVYWERRGSWDFTRAALQGSSFYKLPKFLQWLSGNIGFHHIHHLSSRIPNYNLERCHMASQMFLGVTPVTFMSSLKALRLRLWDEQAKTLVGYKHLRMRGRPCPAAAALKRDD